MTFEEILTKLDDLELRVIYAFNRHHDGELLKIAHDLGDLIIKPMDSSFLKKLKNIEQ